LHFQAKRKYTKPEPVNRKENFILWLINRDISIVSTAMRIGTQIATWNPVLAPKRPIAKYDINNR
jgi:hypothetical protein